MNKYISYLQHPVIRNSISLYVIQFAGFVLPLVLLPFLSRKLTPNYFGLVILSQTFAAWISIIIEFGFTISATRRVATTTKSNEISVVVSEILSSQFLLIILTVFVSLLCLLLIPSFRLNPIFLLYGWILGILTGLSPIWYYQGIEKLTFPAILEAGLKIIVICLIILIVKSDNDAQYVILFMAASGAISLTILFSTILKTHNFTPNSIKNSLAFLKKENNLFIFRSMSSIYTSASGLIMGIFVPANILGYYLSAEKITRAAIRLVSPLVQAIYPRISRAFANDEKHARNLFKKCVLFYFLMGIFLALILFILSKQIVIIVLGKAYSETEVFLRVLSPLPLIVSMGTVIGTLFVLPNKLDKEFTVVVIIGGLINLLLGPLLIITIGQLGMAWSVICSELFVLSGLFLIYHKNKKVLPIRV